MSVAPHAAVLVFSFLATIVFSVFILAFFIRLWGQFLDTHEHKLPRVRFAMLFILALATAFEIGLAANGLTRQWVVVVSLIVNFWGGLDALLRFPAEHDLDSFFAMKQFGLIVVKSLSYAFGITGFSAIGHIGMFLVVLLIDIWGLSVLYLLALPLDTAEHVLANDRDDVDLIVRMWQLTTCLTERQRCMRSCEKWFHRRLLAASEGSPTATAALCAASPLYRRAFSKDRRSV